ncbi:hypothetical protein [Haloprofundus salilacus]|nr:hypothetical protein [Haloprofundus salilacus]
MRRGLTHASARGGRINQIQTTFDSKWVSEAQSTYMEAHRRTRTEGEAE